MAPGITTINQRDGAGKTWYNALQVKLDKRFSHGLQALLAYTYSKTEDNIATLGIHPTLEIRQRAPGRQRQQDAGHPARSSRPASATSCPFARDATGATKAPSWAAGRSSAITLYHSGDPLDARVSAANLNNGGGNWPNVTCDPMANAPRTPAGLVRHELLRQSRAVPVRELPIQRRARADRVQHRRLRSPSGRAIGKTAALEMRLDVFNVFNRAHFANPTVNNFGTAAFGTISNTRLTPREGQIGVKFLF